MENIQFVRIAHYPERWGKHINGGEYAFYQEYSREKAGQPFEARFYTSSEFDYCVVRGVFQSCEDCPDYDDGCKARGLYFSEKTLAGILELNKGNVRRVEYF